VRPGCGPEQAVDLVGLSNAHPPVQEVPVSAECVDLVTRMLVADPLRRLTLDQVKIHPWFTTGLPPGALDMNDFLMTTTADLREVRPRARGSALRV
jgi:serine/threonine protein kinase